MTAVNYTAKSLKYAPLLLLLISIDNMAERESVIQSYSS